MADQLITGTTLIEDKRTGTGLVWSITGDGFTPTEPDVDDVTYTTGLLTLNGANINVHAAVNLPNGAKVTGVVVHANVTTENWFLVRRLLNAGAAQETMATAALGTEDTTITSDIIDNNNYGYFFSTDSMDATDDIQGARITFTL